MNTTDVESESEYRYAAYDRPGRLLTGDDLPYAKRYIASLDPWLSGWPGGPLRVFHVFCCDGDLEAAIVRKNLINAGLGVERDTPDRGTFDQKFAERMIDSFPGSIIPGIIGCITPMNSLWAVVNWPGNAAYLISKPSRWYESGAFPDPPNWRRTPALEGPFETGCWTEAGNDLVLYIQTDRCLHGLLSHVFEHTQRSVMREWGGAVVRPDTEVSVLMPTVMASSTYRAARELYKRAGAQFRREELGCLGRFRIDEETFDDVHNWMMRQYPHWFVENRLQHARKTKNKDRSPRPAAHTASGQPAGATC